MGTGATPSPGHCKDALDESVRCVRRWRQGGQSRGQDGFCVVTHSLLCTCTGPNRHRTHHSGPLSPLRAPSDPTAAWAALSPLVPRVQALSRVTAVLRGRRVPPLLTHTPAPLLHLGAVTSPSITSLLADTEASLRFLKSGGSGGEKKAQKLRLWGAEVQFWVGFFVACGRHICKPGVLQGRREGFLNSVVE